MAHINKVMRSINQPGENICVDVFVRPDGSYGFEEYRREPEDGRGWYPVGYYSEQRFQDYEAALEAARNTISWLGEKLD
ncbi:MAG: hypothetical protein KGI75_22445 [Rhizobiaceae bacterium]|nr:hypothetical protein [Rhizobiaceae bacterium]